MGFYSPGYICPSGYDTACLQSPVVSSGHVFFSGDFSFLRQPLGKEIAIGCCPMGFGCAITSAGDYQTQFCYADVFSTTITGTPCVEYEVYGSGMTSTTLPSLSTAAISLGNILVDMYAPLFQLIYHSSDLPHASNPADTNDSFRSWFPSTRSSNYGNATITLTTSSPPAPRVRGTPSGAIAGIAIGGLLGLGLLITLIWFLLLWRQRQKKRRYRSSSELMEGPRAELPGQANQIHEVDAREKPKELPSATTYLAQELEAPNVVHELHGDTVGETLVSRVYAELE
ncbi:MAG: hypothetical protein M1821_000749 [Bathelium mastoideum]|nr:MAG: hypothetical protein M1821_000749 [Bathelium mastoideum]